MVVTHPTENKTERRAQGQTEIHAQFLGELNRGWVNASLVKQWGQQVDRSGGDMDEGWKKGLEDAEKVKDLSNEERLEALAVELLPSDEEWSDMEVSPGSKENKPEKNDSPNKKRRRIMVLDSDDSDGDTTFEPSK